MPRGAPMLAVAVAAAVACPTARADRELTLDDALAIARRYNRDINAGRARLAQAVQGIALARAALMPTLSLQGRYTHNYKPIVFDFTAFQKGTVGLAEVIRSSTPIPSEQAALAAYEQQANAAIAAATPIQIQLSEQLDGSASASFPLVAPSAWHALSAARATARSDEANQVVFETNVLLGVAQAFFVAAAADDVVVARDHATVLAAETVQISRDRANAGVTNRVDILRAETALVRAEQDLAEARVARGTAYRALETLLGTRGLTRVVPLRPPPGSSDPTDELIWRALGSRPELVVERTKIAAARSSALAWSWGWAPTLSAWGNARVFNYTGFSGDKYSWAVGLQLDWLILDGGTRTAQRRIADARRVEAQIRLDLEIATISDEVVNARETLAAKRTGIVAAGRALQLANETLRIVRVQYGVGTVTQLDVLQAQDSVVAAEVALARAHLDLSLAEVELARAVGTFPPVAHS
jgi:outer membrane protein TolC